MKRTDLRLLYIHSNTTSDERSNTLVPKPVLQLVIDKQSVMFFLEFNHDTLTIWYHIDQCHFAYTAESLVPYLKLCGLLTQTSIIKPATDCTLMERKLSIGLLSTSSISFNDNAIERNFYPKKFYSLKLFKDLLPP